ncbi:MAG: DUF2384 domain-containing protein [Rhodospirillales bacterium]|nr:DUF2384 domain-containing protein [Rhodospirillales bacterium]
MSNYEIALDRATYVLGDKARAKEWLEKMSGTLGSSPKELLSTDEGLQRVMRHIKSVELANDTD